MRNLERLKHCLVGSWGVFANEALDLGSLSSWVRSNWRLVGNLHLMLLGGTLILFVFYNAKGR